MRGKIHFTNFPKPRRSCVRCHHEFAAKAEIRSTIIDEAEEKVQRVDYCPACFEQEQSNQHTENQKEPHSDTARWKLVKPEERINKKLSWKELDERAFLLLEEALAIAHSDSNSTSEQQIEAWQEISLLTMHLLRRKKIALEREDAAEAVYRICETGVTFMLQKVAGMSLEQQGLFQRKLFAS